MFVCNSTWGHVKIIYAYFRKQESDDFHWGGTSLQIYFLLNIYFSTTCLISMSVTLFSKGGLKGGEGKYQNDFPKVFS